MSTTRMPVTSLSASMVPPTTPSTTASHALSNSSATVSGGGGGKFIIVMAVLTRHHALVVYPHNTVLCLQAHSPPPRLALSSHSGRMPVLKRLRPTILTRFPLRNTYLITLPSENMELVCVLGGVSVLGDCCMPLSASLLSLYLGRGSDFQHLQNPSTVSNRATGTSEPAYAAAASSLTTSWCSHAVHEHRNGCAAQPTSAAVAEPTDDEAIRSGAGFPAD